MTAATLDKPKPFPLRKRTGTAQFHMSKQAVDFGYEDLEKLNPRETVQFVAKLLWGSDKEMPCPHCGTIAEHYFSFKELRWKCTCCGKRFSVTSNTVLSGRKLALLKILKIAFSWANGASGKPALQLRRDWNVSYPTVYTLVQKLREGLYRGFNTGMVCGVAEMDGMDVNGRRYREKRNKPLGGKAAGKPKIPDFLLKPKEGAGELVGPPTPPKWGKTTRQPVDRRIHLSMSLRGVAKGNGSVATRTAIATAESSATVTLMATKYASSESTIMSDEDPSYIALRPLFAGHKTINHSIGYALPDGVNNNQSESFNWRVRRGVESIYLSPSNKYLAEYVAEQGWRNDTRRMSTGAKLKHLLRTALGVGLSLWWRGYTHGKHRTEELLLEGNQFAKARGKAPGAKPPPPR